MKRKTKNIVTILGSSWISLHSAKFSGNISRCEAIRHSSSLQFPSEIIFLGTGSSSGTPYIYNLMVPPDLENLHPLDRRGVEISRKAIVGDARENKNYRCNPSILIRYRANNDENHTNILIDAGKTFRESAVRWFPFHNVRSIDSVLLTHGHADSIFGIDDLRSTQSRVQLTPLPVYQSVECEAITRQVFGYLYFIPSPPSLVTKAVKRFVANIDWRRIVPYESFESSGLQILPIPVMHGEDMTCMGFIFGRTNKVCYLSDISRMLPKSLEMIRTHGPIDVLIVDSIRIGKNTLPNATHFTSDDAIALCKQIRPKKTYLIGMASVMDHESTNTMLQGLLESDGLDIQLSYDGMKLDVML